MSLGDVDAGFEIKYSSVVDLIAIQDDDYSVALIRALAEHRDSCITFRWGSNYLDVPCVEMASFALARHFDAIVSIEGKPPRSLESFRFDVHEAIAAVRSGRYT